MEKELKALPGSDVRKVAIAAKIWETTTMSMSWISENLGMKSAANASQQIRRQRAGKKFEVKLPKALRNCEKLSAYVA
jgi:hypothetical protein